MSPILSLWLLACTPETPRPPADSPDPVVESPVDSPIDSPAPPPDRLLINELMASNDGSYSLRGETPDWIELYNPHDTAFSLEGWTLDDGGEPGALQGELAAGGFLLLFADNSEEAGHLPFSLSAEGETLTLTAAGGWRSDAVRYGPQTADIAAARVRDGDESAGWAFVAGGTPGRSNAR